MSAPAALLDSLDSLLQFDPKGMYGLTVGFVDQCRKAVEIGRQAALCSLTAEVFRVHLTGLGGSAAGGDFIRCVMDAEGRASFAVNRDYTLPAWIGANDLVFCASYSGSTEETLSAYSDAKAKGAQIIAITSGGKLGSLAEADGYPVIHVPGGQPPRTAMGFMMVPVLVALERLGLVAKQDWDEALGALNEGASLWSAGAAASSNPAKKLAIQLHGALPILYGLGPAAAVVANRWKCQCHENAKLLAFANGYPELNHNEILGWIGANRQSVGRFGGVRLSLGGESEKMHARALITERVIGDICPFTSVAPACGHDARLLSRMLSLTFMGDFVSIYLARLEEADPEVIPSIDLLKSELAKID